MGIFKAANQRLRRAIMGENVDAQRILAPHSANSSYAIFMAVGKQLGSHSRWRIEEVRYSNSRFEPILTRSSRLSQHLFA